MSPLMVMTVIDAIVVLAVIVLCLIIEVRHRQIQRWHKNLLIGQAEEKTAAKQELLDVAIWGITHYLPNRARNISILCQQATFTNNDQLARVSLAQIRYNNQQITKLIESISFYESICHDFSMCVVPLNGTNLVRRTVQAAMLNCRDSTAAINVNELPDFMGDSVLVEKLMEILLDNAIRYSDPKEAIYINIGAIKAPTGFCGIEIADTGMGMDAFQVHQLGKVGVRFNERSGAGLGLAIARKIIGIHAAQWQIKSKKGKGTTVSLFFPL